MYIGRNVSHPLILGWDFIKMYVNSINVDRGTMTILNKEIPMLRKNRDSLLCCNLITNRNERIPPETQVFVNAKPETSPFQPVPYQYRGKLESQYFQDEDIRLHI